MVTVQPEPFDPVTACVEYPALCAGDVSPEPLCTLRCHERFLNDEMQPNDAWADAENAESWRRFYAANPGAEEAMRAACDPKTYEKGTA